MTKKTDKQKEGELTKLMNEVAKEEINQKKETKMKTLQIPQTIKTITLVKAILLLAIIAAAFVAGTYSDWKPAIVSTQDTKTVTVVKEAPVKEAVAAAPVAEPSK